MTLRETIAQQLAGATKAKDAVRMNTLRMLRAAMKNREVELRAELEDGEILRVIGSQIKQRKESMRQYEEAGRVDLADKEGEELEILMSFMPEQISEEAVNRAVIEIIEELDAKDMKDMGRVMKAAMAKFAGSADGKMVNEIVRKKLSG
jgi:uncharacterized protein YqeY